MSEQPVDAEAVHDLLAKLPRVKITPETISQNTIDHWYKREADYRTRLAGIADLVDPCPPPRVYEGMDWCPTHPGSPWPCTSTQVAWLARGLDIPATAKSILAALPVPEEFEW